MMRRSSIAAAALLTATALAPAAQAQWAYHPYGWGGWGGAASIQGDTARGMGVFAAGAGQYNQQTAIANSINADTRMRLNEYIWQSEQINRKEYYDRMARQAASRRQAAGEIEQRQLYRPERQDIVSGDALNAILHQLRSPGVPDSLLSNAGYDLSLTGEQIKQIPLRFASRGVVISAHRLAADNAWPLPLQGGAFAELRKQYQALVEQVRNLPDEAEVPDATIVQAIGLIDRMRTLAREQLRGPEFAEAERFLKAHAGMLQMARQPDIRQVLDTAYKRESIPLPNALLGMDAFNLSFGKADDPQEQALYITTLYPMLADLRDRVAREMGGKIPDSFQASVGEQAPTGAFDKLPWEQLSRTEAHPAAPAPEETDEPQAPAPAPAPGR